MDISKLELNWEKVSWDISSRIGTDMSKITEWGSLFYLDKDVPPKVVVAETWNVPTTCNVVEGAIVPIPT